MADQAAFDSYLRSLDIGRLEDVIASLETFESEFASEHVVPGTIVLLNLRSNLPERPRGMFELEARLVVARVTYRLLRSLGDPDNVERAVRAILPELTSLSAKLELINQVGYREGVGHKLVSEAAAVEFEKSWRSEVRATSPSDLEREGDLLRLLFSVKRDLAADEPPFEIPETPELTLAILRAARGEVRSQSMDSRAIRRSTQLQWDALSEIFGGPEQLSQRVNRLKEIHPEGEDELLSLVDRYLGGWRPNDFNDD
ncbi:MAG TPA: hypothetical protein VF746_17495 [Longimicrobium sp.]